MSYTQPEMSKRYDQYCPVCHALGLVGERWALLIVRELLRGPKRYTDLVEGMPGIGTNILAARLKELEQGGILRKRKLPPPAASTVYELTEYGAELEEAGLRPRPLGRPLAPAARAEGRVLSGVGAQRLPRAPRRRSCPRPHRVVRPPRRR